MSTDRSDREVPEDETRKQILVIEPLRDYLRERAKAEERTYSEQLVEWMPDEWQDYEFTFEGRIVNIKPTPEVHGMIDSMAGPRVSPGDVIAVFALIDALDRGDVDAAGKIAGAAPDVLWDYVEEFRREDDA